MATATTLPAFPAASAARRSPWRRSDPQACPSAPVAEQSDAALVRRTLEGAEDAFAELVRRYRSPVWRAVCRIAGRSLDNEDAVQETFLRAYLSLGRFDPERSFGPWIIRIAVNHCLDQLRRRKARRCSLWSELDEDEQRRILDRLST